MYTIAKRTIDIFLSALGLILSSPVWLIAVIGIEINDPGPVFYMASRLGKDNKPFKMFKFRSMRVVKEQAVQTLRPEEDRIFAFGKVLRRLKIDEVPQILNIFLGQMSFVGPRPVAPDQFDIFRTGRMDITKSVCPGLTGPAALYDYIYGDQFEEADLEAYEKMVLPTRKELEVAYILHKSFGFDCKMFFMTVGCVVCTLIGKEPERIYRYLVQLGEQTANAAFVPTENDATVTVTQ